MLHFLAANWGTFLIGALVAAVVLLILVRLFRDRKKGASSCGCGCEHCPSAGLCHSQKEIPPARR